MSTEELIGMINNCITVAKQFKKILDDEQVILRCNHLEKIKIINEQKEMLLLEYANLKSEICERLGIPKKRFDKINLEEHLDSLVKNNVEFKKLMTELWSLHHSCHNQFIINQNVTIARMQFLNKSIVEIEKNIKSQRILSDTSDSLSSTSLKK